MSNSIKVKIKDLNKEHVGMFIHKDYFEDYVDVGFTDYLCISNIIHENCKLYIFIYNECYEDEIGHCISECDADIILFYKNPQVNTETHILNIIKINSMNKMYIREVWDYKHKMNFHLHRNSDGSVEYYYDEDKIINKNFEFENDFNFHVGFLLRNTNYIGIKNVDRCNIINSNNLLSIYVKSNNLKTYDYEYYYKNIDNPRYAHYELATEYKNKIEEIKNKYKKDIDLLENSLYNINKIEDNLENFQDVKELLQSKIKYFVNKRQNDLDCAWFDYELSYESLDKYILYTKYLNKIKKENDVK